MRDFEDGLLRLVRENNADILDSIRNEKEISNTVGEKLKTVVAGFAKSFA